MSNGITIDSIDWNIGIVSDGVLQAGFLPDSTPQTYAAIYTKEDSVWRMDEHGNHVKLTNRACAYCGNERISDKRGGCASCGGPL